ncbi:hypothetical protein GCM10017562_02650 [Streptomyces roseofulvus]
MGDELAGDQSGVALHDLADRQAGEQGFVGQPVHLGPRPGRGTRPRQLAPPHRPCHTLSPPSRDLLPYPA